jgi:uncharacterized membrane protein
MTLRLRALWFRLRESYWFAPAVMAAASILLATLTIEIDRRVTAPGLGGRMWVYTGGPEGARAVLAALAGSTITVTALVFSITIVALSFASSQLGPRLLVSFRRDTGNQVVLGTFVATFLYCLLVLRTVRSGPDGQFVPNLSVTVAVVLAILSLGVLVYFIHHVAVGIQADAVIATVSRDLDHAIDDLFPEKLGQESAAPSHAPDPPLDDAADVSPVAPPGTGYIRAIDGDQLMDLAVERDLRMTLLHRPGHFVTRDMPLAEVWPAERVDDDVARSIAGTVIVGDRRTLEQDVEFAVDQLVEVALRALSPGINDAFTALTCVDRLGAALGRLAGRAIPSRYRYDDKGVLRIITGEVTFAGVVDAAFDQIRQASRGNVAVTVRLLEALRIVLQSVRRLEDREPLLHQAAMIWRGAEAAVTEPGDRAAIEDRYQRLHTAMRRLE